MELTIQHDGEEKTFFNVNGVWVEDNDVWFSQPDTGDRTFSDAEVLAVYRE